MWIDPIDNTKGFIEGKLEGVTILIGMARKNISYLGVVATPYQLEQRTRVFKPKLYVGCAPQLKAYQLEGTSSSKWTVLAKPDTHDPYILATSKRVTNKPVD